MRQVLVTLALAAVAGAVSAQAVSTSFPGIGRAATAKEVTAWDIDVRPDFKGLPAGSGSVEKGMEVWEGKCASCHGVFGESNEVFSPLIGGTTKEDVKSGRVARLTDAGFPGRTTMMKLSSVGTLWDYINRAMPWNAPKSLSTEEVYAVTAYLLNLGGVLADDFVLSDKNIAQVVRRMSNVLGGSGGAIVNVSSMAATIGGRPGACAYAASKGAVDVFTTGFAREVAGQGIRVNTVRPGVTATGMTPQLELDADLRRRVEASIPMGRIGQPQEVAALIVWLLSAEASFVTGAHVNVGGGGFLVASMH